ncbi:TPA: hypothetical protein EYO77_03410 [Candidatus Poribacteria bacterium]|nr:hypothetical protein [Candidatus Poribacteria bacterium]HIM10226.1 hypothetical protein [Candidatus Poribacteria bacterium]
MNGQYDSEIPHGSVILKNEYLLQIGAIRAYEVFFNGLIDEVRLWNFARTEAEIQSIMNSILTGKEEGLVGYWNFDDGTTKDLSPYGNDGSLRGDAETGKELLTLNGHNGNVLEACWSPDQKS